MAQACFFEGANGKRTAPAESEETVSDLHVFANGMCCISCWELSEEELAEILRTKRIYLSVFSGITQPPVFVGGEGETRSVVQDYGGVWKKGH